VEFDSLEEKLKLAEVLFVGFAGFVEPMAVSGAVGERRREPRVLWLSVVAWLRRGRPGPCSALEGLRAALRPGAHLPLPQADFGMDHPSRGPPRTDRPLDVARARSLYPTAPSAPSAPVGGGSASLAWERRYESGRLTPVRVRRAVLARLAELGIRPRNRRNPADAHRDGPKDGDRAGPSATRP
jgi:hypothetical protein